MMMSTPSSAANRIVVGVDGSEASETALRWAADEARLRGVGVHVVGCWDFPALPWGPYQPPLSGEGLENDTREVVEKEIENVLGAAPEGLDVSVEVILGPASLRLLDFGDIAEMIVVGSRGRGGFTGLLLGSVSQHLAEHARCPVVIVRSEAA
jgi:nucleotide-binding universal stress UspA family protein